MAEATHTTPPIVSASTAKGGASIPATRNIAQVAISVAIAMPLMGFEQLPIRPQMREDTVTNKKPEDNHEDRPRANCAENTGLRTGNRPKGQHRPHQHYDDEEPRTRIHRQIAFGAQIRRGAARAFGTHVLEAAVKAETIVGTVLISVISPAAAQRLRPSDGCSSTTVGRASFGGSERARIKRQIRSE